MQTLTQKIIDDLTGKGIVYVASPYSDPNMYVRRARFFKACVACGELISKGVWSFSPIVHGHSIVENWAYALPTDAASWQAYNESIQKLCIATVVLTIDGWRESVGVQAEIDYARWLGQPVYYR